MTVVWPSSLFSAAPPDRRACLRLVDGASIDLDVRRWHDALHAPDREALARTRGPVIDIGCGPGRHVGALAAAGRETIGIDVSAAAVRATRRRGAHAVRTSVWGPVPRAGHWETALLLDGNIGIGGNPVLLLRRVRDLLGGERRIVVELAVGTAAGHHVVRVEHGGRVGPPFPWATLDAATVPATARAAGLAVAEIWHSGGRAFALLAGPGPAPGGPSPDPAPTA